MKETTQQDIYKAQRDINKAFQNALTLLSENQEQLFNEIRENRNFIGQNAILCKKIAKQLLEAANIIKDRNNG